MRTLLFIAAGVLAVVVFVFWRRRSIEAGAGPTTTTGMNYQTDKKTFAPVKVGAGEVIGGLAAGGACLYLTDGKGGAACAGAAAGGAYAGGLVEDYVADPVIGWVGDQFSGDGTPHAPKPSGWR